MTEIPIIHNREESIFQYIVDNDIAYVKYSLIPTGINIIKTFVPENLEGQGIASRLVKEAFDYAKKNHLKIRPTCSYVKIWSERHPQYQEIVE